MSAATSLHTSASFGNGPAHFDPPTPPFTWLFCNSAHWILTPNLLFHLQGTASLAPTFLLRTRRSKRPKAQRARRAPRPRRRRRGRRQKKGRARHPERGSSSRLLRPSRGRRTVPRRVRLLPVAFTRTTALTCCHLFSLVFQRACPLCVRPPVRLRALRCGRLLLNTPRNALFSPIPISAPFFSRSAETQGHH